VRQLPDKSALRSLYHEKDITLALHIGNTLYTSSSYRCAKTYTLQWNKQGAIGMNIKKPLVVIAAVISMGAVSVSAALAQGTAPSADGIANLAAVQMCSTTDYTSTAAKALGISAGELRLALTAGTSLVELAKTKNVEVTTITAALTAARKAELDQAVKDGLLTQAQADALASGRPMMGFGMRNRPGNDQNKDQGNNPAGPNQPSAPDQQATQDANAPQPPQGGDKPQDGPNAQGPAGPGSVFSGMMRGIFGGRGMVGLRITPRNSVNNAVVAAEALGMKCSDLVKLSLSERQSLAQIAHTKNVDVKTVITALVKAHQAARAQDVKENLTTQALVDASSSDLQKRIEDFVFNGRLMGGMGSSGGRGPGR
jgi:hypothetical protein